MLEKKIADASEKIDLAAQTLRLSGFSEASAKKGKALPAPPLNLLTAEATKTVDGKSLELYKDRLKQKTLAFELELLDGELKKFAAG